MERGAQIEALRAALVSVVADHLTPVAQRYGYSEVPLEATIKWRPLVLILGNYSSGKSTLINELLGGDIQATGQAPTDDAFTVLTGGGPGTGPVRVTEEREGTAVLADPEYPFANLKRHGQRFAAHFRLKQVSSPFLAHLALIDTPGMLDSTAERDRGYDYQAVLGDLAEIADLVLVLFDPHKAGTVREAHASLRETLPAKTFEDRVIFVLNRVDECDSLADLLRVYGTLCWNLSQMLGRKDIPPIRLTYAEDGARPPGLRPLPEYLRYFANQRQELKRLVLDAPRYRLDHLAAYAELHGERLAHFLEALVAYRKRRRRQGLRHAALGLVASCAVAVAAGVALALHGLVADPLTTVALGAAAVAGCFALWVTAVTPSLTGAFHRGAVRQADGLTPLVSQSRRDSWQAVRAHVRRHLEESGGKLAMKAVRADLGAVRKAVDGQVQAARVALRELGTKRHE